MIAFDNDVICHCGKKGCLETGASGSFIYRRFMDKVAEGNSTILEHKIKNKEPIIQEDILDAAMVEVLSMVRFPHTAPVAEITG